MPRATLDSRRERVARINAKRPPTVTVRAVYRPNSATLDDLADLVLEILDERMPLDKRATPGEGGRR